MTNFSLLPAIVMATSLAMTVGCSGSDSATPIPDEIPGGGDEAAAANTESEPNNGFHQAMDLAIGEYGVGDVTAAGDTDFWSVTLLAGSLVSIEVFGVRMDQPTWDDNSNVPRLTFYDTDGTSSMAEHDYSGNFSNGWDFSRLDLDLPSIMIPADGTYFIAVTQDRSSSDGGEYAVRIKQLPTAGMQTEIEAPGVTGDNDGHLTAEPISPGPVHGYLAASDNDFFSFTVTGESIARFSVSSYRNGVSAGGGYADPTMLVYDRNGSDILIERYDTFFYDPAIDCFLVHPGTYYLRLVNESSSAGADYFLSFDLESASGAIQESEPNGNVTSANAISYGRTVTGTLFPFDNDVFSYEGRAGDMVRVQVFGEDSHQAADDSARFLLVDSNGTTVLETGGDRGLRIHTAILQTTGTHYALLFGDYPTEYAFGIELVGSSAYEMEPNDALAESNTFNAKGRYSGVIETDSDVDLVSFSADADTVETLSIYASSDPTGSNGFGDMAGHGSRLYPLLRILDSTGSELALSDSEPDSGVYAESVANPLPTSSVSFVVPETGTYYIEVSDTEGEFSAEHFYVLVRN